MKTSAASDIFPVFANLILALWTEVCFFGFSGALPGDTARIALCAGLSFFAPLPYNQDAIIADRNARTALES